MRQHQHDAVEPELGCPTCILLRSRMLISNAVDAMEASQMALTAAGSLLKELDGRVKGYRKQYSPEELERRRAHGKKLGAKVKKAWKEDK